MIAPGEMGTIDDGNALDPDLAMWQSACALAALERGLLLQLPSEVVSLARATATAPALTERLLQVLRTMGWVDCREGRWQLTPAFGALAQPKVHEKLRCSRRASFSQIQDLIARARQPRLEGGWKHEDPDVFSAAGAVLDADTPAAKDFVRRLVGSLDGALARLDSDDGRFLDVGCGVASLAIVLCSCFPKLRIVGVDPLEGPLRIARAEIAAADLSDRIELRQQKVQALTQVDAFDMAFFPLPFIPEVEVGGALAATCRALKPGAWVLTVSTMPIGDEAQCAMTWFRAALYGGPAWSNIQAEEALRGVGLVEVATLPGAPGLPHGPIVGRKPQASGS